MSSPLDALTFELNGNRLIEASAGTGKTYTLAALYLRLVLGHGQGDSAFAKALLPPDILVVTFTRAATAELRERIRARLVEAASAFRTGITDDIMLQRLIADYSSSSHAACASRLSMAAEWMDDAAIFTIHSWCQRMLTEHAFDSLLSFGESLTKDSKELLYTLACDYWRRYFYPLNEAFILFELGKIAKTPDDLLHEVQPWLQADLDSLTLMVEGKPIAKAQEPKQAAKPLLEWQSRFDVKCQEAQQALEPDVFLRLDDAYKNGWLNGNKYRASSWEMEKLWWQDVIANPSLLSLQNKELTKMLAKFCAEKLVDGQKKGQPQVTHPLFTLFDELNELLASKPDISLSVRHHAALWILDEFNRRKRESAVLDFNDLLTHLRYALSTNPVLATRIREQYPLAMVDEFQDTDPIQFEIFQTIYPDVASKDTALIMVGDPKQAIYSFRGADLHTYLKARQLTVGRHYTLDTNFRSTHGVVCGVNALFEQAEKARGAFGFGDAKSTALPFLPVKANGKKDGFWLDNSAVPDINYWLLNTDIADFKKGHYLQEMATACANKVAELLSKAQQGDAGFSENGQSIKALVPSDIAILVRDKNEAALVRKELSLRNVRSVYLSDNESIYKSSEAYGVLCWLQACYQIDDENLLRSALALPFSQNSDDMLNNWLNDEHEWERLTDKVREFKEIWRKKGVLAMISAWLHYFSLPAKWLAKESGERSLTNVLHLAELLQTESQQRDGESGLIRWFAEKLAAPTHDDEDQLRLESEQQLVQVVTIHKSKGLQYNLVFLPFICAHRSAKKDQPQRYFEQGKMFLDLAPDEDALAKAEHERLLEDIRLLYVALTRPVYACWLGFALFSEGRAKSSNLAQSAIGYLLNINEDPSLNDLKAAIAPLNWHADSIPTEHKLILTNSLSHIVPAKTLSAPVRKELWWVASYSALKTVSTALKNNSSADTTTALAADSAFDSLLQEEAAEPFLQSEDKSSIHYFLRGAVPGTFLHQLLEDAQHHGFKKADDTFIDTLLEKHLAQHNWQEWHGALKSWLIDMLKSPIIDVGLSLSELKNARAELEFWLQSRAVNVLTLDKLITQAILPGFERPALMSDTLNGMLKGFIDLTLQGEDGRYWVLDYKSNWLGTDDSAYSQDEMQQAFLAKRYDVQAALYLLALHRLLKLRQPGYLANPEKYIGGALYWFVRAPQNGQLSLKANLNLIHDLDKLFAGEALKEHADAV